jgi:hypothetical protein
MFGDAGVASARESTLGNLVIFARNSSGVVAGVGNTPVQGSG